MDILSAEFQTSMIPENCSAIIQEVDKGSIPKGLVSWAKYHHTAKLLGEFLGYHVMVRDSIMNNMSEIPLGSCLWHVDLQTGRCFMVFVVGTSDLNLLNVVVGR